MGSRGRHKIAQKAARKLRNQKNLARHKLNVARDAMPTRPTIERRGPDSFTRRIERNMRGGNGS